MKGGEVLKEEKCLLYKEKKCGGKKGKRDAENYRIVRMPFFFLKEF